MEKPLGGGITGTVIPDIEQRGWPVVPETDLPAAAGAMVVDQIAVHSTHEAVEIVGIAALERHDPPAGGLGRLREMGHGIRLLTVLSGGQKVKAQAVFFDKIHRRRQAARVQVGVDDCLQFIPPYAGESGSPFQGGDQRLQPVRSQWMGIAVQSHDNLRALVARERVQPLERHRMRVRQRFVGRGLQIRGPVALLKRPSQGLVLAVIVPDVDVERLDLS